MIVAVSTDPLDKAKLDKDKIHLPFPVLSDQERLALNLYNTVSLSTYPAPDGGKYNHATLILIDAKGMIRWIYRNSDYKVRATVADDLEEIRKVQQSGPATGGAK